MALGALLAVAGVAGAAADDAPLTLESALRRALLYNRDLARLAAGYEVAWLDRGVAEGDFAWRWQPSLSRESFGGMDTSRAGLDVLRKLEWGTEMMFGAEAAQTKWEDGSSDRGTVRWSVSQPIFRYAGREMNRETVARAESRMRTALRGLEMAKAELALRVAQTFYDVHRAEQQSRIEEAARDRLDRLRRLAAARARQGRAVPVDVWRIESQYAEAVARAQAARARVEILHLDLADLLNLSPEARPALASPPPPPPMDDDLEEALAAALAHRLEIAQAEQDLEDARRGVRLAQRRRRPDLRLTASVERRGLGGADEDDTAWALGLRTGSGLGGAAERWAVPRARLDERLAADDLESVRRAVEQEVRRAFIEMTHARADLEPAERNRQAAAARLRMARRLFELGRGDSFTVSDAETQFLQAEGAWLNAHLESAMTIYRVRRAAGTLLQTPPELGPRGTGGPENPR